MRAIESWWMRRAWARAARRFERSAQDPVRAQQRRLGGILKRHARTAFGQAHRLTRVRSPEQFARAVPIRDDEELRPWVGLPLQGKAHPHGEAMRVWLHHALRAHPRALSGKVLALGIDLPIPRRRSALPVDCSQVDDLEDAAFMALRLSVTQPVTLIATSAPSTLLRLARVGQQDAERIVEAVRAGRLGCSPSGSTPAQAALHARLERQLSPDPVRAERLEACLKEHGALLPRAVWPGLALVACKLGGDTAPELREAWGAIALRGLGLSAGRVPLTISLTDTDSVGALALESSYYETVPADAPPFPFPRVLRAHELQVGQLVRLILTTPAGLFRYDTRQVVEVQGWYRGTPLVAPRCAG